MQMVWCRFMYLYIADAIFIMNGQELMEREAELSELISDKK